MIDAQLPTFALLGLKILVLVGIGVYAIFALVMVQQARLMSNILEDPFEMVLKAISLIHLVAAIGLFFLAIVLL